MDQLRENGWEKETHTSDEINEEEIRKVFSIVDRDSSGFLSKKEAKRACKLIADKFGVTEVDILISIMSVRCCQLKVESWLSELDIDGDGQLSYAEFKMSIAGNLLIDI